MVLDKNRMIEKIGTLSQKRINEIIDNIIWVLRALPNRDISPGGQSPIFSKVRVSLCESVAE